MENQNLNLKPMQTVHLTMCLAPMLFLLIVFFIKNQTETVNVDSLHYYLAPVFAVLAIIVGRLTFKKQLLLIEKDTRLSEKLIKYQSALLTRLAFSEAAALFNAISFFLLGHYAFVIMTLIIVIYMFTFRPSRFRVAEDLQLNYIDLN